MFGQVFEDLYDATDLVREVVAKEDADIADPVPNWQGSQEDGNHGVMLEMEDIVYSDETIDDSKQSSSLARGSDRFEQRGPAGMPPRFASAFSKLTEAQMTSELQEYELVGMIQDFEEERTPALDVLHAGTMLVPTVEPRQLEKVSVVANFFVTICPNLRSRERGATLLAAITLEGSRQQIQASGDEHDVDMQRTIVEEDGPHAPKETHVPPERTITTDNSANAAEALDPSMSSES